MHVVAAAVVPAASQATGAAPTGCSELGFNISSNTCLLAYAGALEEGKDLHLSFWLLQKSLVDEEVAGLLATALPFDGNGGANDINTHITVRTQVYFSDKHQSILPAACGYWQTLWGGTA